MASRNLTVKFVGDTAPLASATKKAQGLMGKFAQNAKAISGSLSNSFGVLGDKIGQLGTLASNVGKSFAGLGAVSSFIAGGAVGVAALAAGFAALSVLAVKTANNMLKINEQSNKLGIGIEPLSRLAFAAHMADASFETLTNSLAKMRENIGGIQLGEKVATPLAALGLSVENIASLQPEEQFITIADALSKIEDPTLRAKIGTELLGKGYKDLAALIAGGRSEIESMMAASKAAITPADKKIIEAYETATKKLSDAWAGFAQKLTSIVLPAITWLIDKLTWVLNIAQKATHWIAKFYVVQEPAKVKEAASAIDSQADAMARAAYVAEELEKREAKRAESVEKIFSGLEDEYRKLTQSTVDYEAAKARLAGANQLELSQIKSMIEENERLAKAKQRLADAEKEIQKAKDQTTSEIDKSFSGQAGLIAQADALANGKSQKQAERDAQRAQIRAEANIQASQVFGRTDLNDSQKQAMAFEIRNQEIIKNQMLDQVILQDRITEEFKIREKIADRIGDAQKRMEKLNPMAAATKEYKEIEELFKSGQINKQQRDTLNQDLALRTLDAMPKKGDPRSGVVERRGSGLSGMAFLERQAKQTDPVEIQRRANALLQQIAENTKKPGMN